MVIKEAIKVSWDLKTKRVEVTYGFRTRVVPGTYETLDDAKAAAEEYARRYMREK